MLRRATGLVVPAGDATLPSEGPVDSPCGFGLASTIRHSGDATGPAVSGAIRGQTAMLN